MRIQLIWSGKKPPTEPKTSAPQDDVLISFDPSSGFTEKDGVVFLSPWIDPSQWTNRRIPRAIEVRVYAEELSQEFLANIQEGINNTATVALQTKLELAPGWNPVAVSGLTPGVEYSFLILAGYDS